MNSTDLLATFREEMADAVEPYLWSDAWFYRNLDEAQMMFCRLTEGIEDSRTATITSVPITAATEWYSLSKLILKVRSALITSTGEDVPVYNSETYREAGIRFDGRVAPLRAFVTGLDKHALRAWPVPSSDIAVTLSVFRLPLVEITDDGDQELEIDRQHHLPLLHWVKHKAYDKQDAETFDRRKSDEFSQRFRQYCAASRVEQERVRRSVRSVSYGGI